MSTMPEAMTLDLRPPAAIYCRVSTHGQAEDGTSLETQEAGCRAYAESHGYRVTEVLHEDFPGDTWLERPELNRLRALVHNREAIAVVVHSTDRLARKPVHLAILIEEFERAGASVQFVTEPLDSSPEGMLIAYVKGYAAEIEREKIRERTIRGKRARATSGRLPQGTGSGLYGYRYDPATGKRTIHEQEAATVRAIFAARIEGQTYHAIMTRLNEAGIPAQQGGQWHPLTVRRILMNETYTGRTVYGRTRRVALGGRRRRIEEQPSENWVEVGDATPAIISVEDYQAAQRIHPRPHKPGAEYLLSSHLTCGVCGSGMVGSALRTYRYYRCQNAWIADKRKRCSLRYIKADWLEDELWQRLAAAIESPEVVAQELVRQRQEETPDLARQLAEVDRQLRACANYETQLIRLYGYGEIDDDAVRREGGRNKQRKQALLQRKQELESQRQAIEQLERAIADLSEFCERVSGNLADLTFAERRQLLNAVTLEATVYPDRVDARVVFPRLLNSTNYATIARTSA